MIDKYGKKLFIFLGCDVVYFILWVIPAIKIPALAVVFTGLGLLTLTALSFIEGEDDTFRHITGEEQGFKVAFGYYSYFDWNCASPGIDIVTRIYEVQKAPCSGFAARSFLFS